jgi:hypothetical protein
MIGTIVKSVKRIGKISFYRLFNSTKQINKTQVDQQLLMNQYRQLAAAGDLPKFQDAGFQSFSQTDEDGFLLFIFALIGTTNKKVVEMCCGDGIECNAANLIINHGFHGLLFDGDAESIALGRKIYSFLKMTRINPPKLVDAWITVENINDLIVNNGMSGDIDLLSLDMDGVDYWILKSIHCIRPRVIILEYNTYWLAHSSVTVPYAPDFQAKIIEGAYYCGASLTAFAKLGQDLGYRLVGANTHKYNAFFIRNDVGLDVLPEVSVESCLPSSEGIFSSTLNESNFPAIAQLPWEIV